MSVQIELDETCRGESEENGRLATESIAESCVNDIERVPPWKSSAERRLRTIRQKEPEMERQVGSLISPELLRAGSGAEMHSCEFRLSFVAM